MPEAPIHLELLPIPVDREAWRAVCAATLSLDAADADRLAAARPLLLRVFADRTVHQLGGVVRPALQGGVACPRHPRIVASERCPRCQAYQACPICLLEPEPGCASCRGKRTFWRRFKAVRVGLLLAVLGLVAWKSWSDQRRLRSWSEPITVGIYLVDADPSVARFTRTLGEADFEPVADFVASQAQRHGKAIRSLLRVSLRGRVTTQSPAAPPPGASALDAIRWSLSLRWWAFEAKRQQGLAASDVELYLRFHPPAAQPDLALSAALPQGRLGVIETIADRQSLGWTRLAAAHELLHVLGAPDTYGADGLPLDPEGLAEPERGYPQRLCEVMSGQIAQSPERAVPAQSLDDCRVGGATARAVGWRE